ncbi:hypothetical protein IE81DRAFT_289225 [Ceraceosorus guamensis]|nr:hypothetical protein IE81DRAFT_289225 [Ceraceosorus guamensis]PWN43063.1 hypothetical protein IE81DRAFT_289225 [Ceraceosorus guamensis]
MERHDTSPRLDWWRNFLLHNAFVPGLFRFINIGFTSATLAIAIRLYVVLKQQAAADSVGSSPLVAIIFGPPTLLHVGWQIYLEYFGKPIGLWAVRNKLLYSLVDLVFICMWSAELSLSFDNYLTSSLVCVADINPFAGLETQSPLTDPAKKPIICRLQGTLIGLVFVSLIAYVIVLVLSLFRIFVRVSGPRTKGTYA